MRIPHAILAAAVCFAPATCFVPLSSGRRPISSIRNSDSDVIVSPFDESGSGSSSSTQTATADGPLELTWENVEMVLDEMRPFLIQDGGNVAIKEIDGPVVRLELQVSVCGD